MRSACSSSSESWQDAASRPVRIRVGIRSTGWHEGVAMADTILANVKVTTLDPANPAAEAVAMRDGKILAAGSEAEVRSAAGPDAIIIDGGGRRLIPGLIDSHIHVIRGGLNYNM